jgi:hypothetical protein
LTRPKAQILPVAAGSHLELIVQTECGYQRKLTGELIPEKNRTILKAGFLYYDSNEMLARRGLFLILGHCLSKTLNHGQRMARFIAMPLCAKEAHFQTFISQLVHPLTSLSEQIP